MENHIFCSVDHWRNWAMFNSYMSDMLKYQSQRVKSNWKRQRSIKSINSYFKRDSPLPGQRAKATSPSKMPNFFVAMRSMPCRCFKWTWIQKSIRVKASTYRRFWRFSESSGMILRFLCLFQGFPLVPMGSDVFRVPCSPWLVISDYIYI